MEPRTVRNLVLHVWALTYMTIGALAISMFYHNKPSLMLPIFLLSGVSTFVWGTAMRIDKELKDESTTES